MNKWKASLSWLGAHPAWLFLGWSLWLAAEYLFLGSQSYLRIHDTADANIPYVVWLARVPSQIFGAPVMPMGATTDNLSNLGFFSLFQLPFIWLPPWWAHGLLTLLQRFVAGYFACRLLRDVLKVSPMIAMGAGMAYSMAHTDLGEYCFMHGLNEPGFPLLIWFFCQLDLRRAGRALIYAALLGMTLGWCMSFVIGIAFLVPLAILFVLVSRKDARTFRGALVLFAAATVFCLVSLAPRIGSLLAMVMNALDSHRATWNVSGDSAVDWAAFTLNRFQFLIRWWLPLPFVLWALLRGDRKSPVWRATFCLLVFSWLGGELLAKFATMLGPRLGFMNGFDFKRFEMGAPLALVFAAALGLDRLGGWSVQWSHENRTAYVHSGAAVAGFVVSLFAVAWSGHVKQAHWYKMRVDGANWHALYEHPDVAALADNLRGQPVRVATAGASHLLAPGALLVQGVEMPDGYLAIYGHRYHMFWSKVIGPLSDMDPEVRGFHLWGSRVYLHHARSGMAMHSMRIPFSEWYDLDLLSLLGVRYFVSNKPVDDARLIPLDTPAFDRRRSRWEGLGLKDRLIGFVRGESPGAIRYLYENPLAFDRFFMVGRVRMFKSEEELWRALGEASGRELREAVFLSGEKDPLGAGAGQGGAVEIVRYALDQMELRTTAETPQILVCANQYYPWWKWWIDGQEATGFPAYGALLGVVVPAGEHRVELVYNPPYLKWSLHSLLSRRSAR